MSDDIPQKANGSDDAARFLIADGQVRRIYDSEQGEDVVALAQTYSDPAGPLSGWRREQVIAALGSLIPDDFPPADIELGQGRDIIEGWLPQTVARYLGGPRQADPAEEMAVHGEQVPALQMPSTAVAVAKEATAWEVGSRQWTTVEVSRVDRRILFAHSRGVITPSGKVVAPPLSGPEDLGRMIVVTCAPGWGLPAVPLHGNVHRVQVWITPEALQAMGFTPELVAGLNKKKLEAAIGEFFGAEVSFSLSGWFTCKFPAVEGNKAREAEIVLMPLMHLDPSKARPADRGILGIEGTKTFVPEDETDIVKLVGDRVTWLFAGDEAMPSYRWSQVGAHQASKALEKVKADAKHGAGIAFKKSPLPEEIGRNGILPSQWWRDDWTNPRFDTAERLAAVGRGDRDIEIDQQSAYLPSAAGLYLGHGTPQWMDPDPAIFAVKQPKFGVFEIEVPPAEQLRNGLTDQLPLPHPHMKWDEPARFWATTPDVLQLLDVVGSGGAGLTINDIELHRAWVWPEHHQWLRTFADRLRDRLVEARAAGRDDYVDFLKAIYTSFFGRMSAVGEEGVWKYPWEHFQQPAWYAAIEAVTRHRAMRHAVRLARDTGIYPYHVYRDAWYYCLPENRPAEVLETPLKNGKRTNGAYRINSNKPIAEL
ncbi:hypothetical protein [Mycobacteroides abscessus]|uniref:hypothetical protein n=2 Tax=Mycobacteroides abscessus TaxID=36809 RepID=UPI000926F5A4|nr:hypothetical protein [Mycobacteroides abscessus]QSN49844.1 hypothetical protein I3U33_27370 [Mycobacteroides abscessus subsp. abscessus]SII80749.1 Uncharacterised protein [Mycobacteroides abscessus subsp. abscessus]SIK60101.1 Uncharacterised protein [Mycobacteroides abscessus subsp. abscessus]SIL81893.1 Uncharacterised protein [Mycobacteroides abscessus subsp. abscessus]SIM15453.1 Uncharacterised protein [Mycobacteroides abscessus subsp. abscessus]